MTFVDAIREAVSKERTFKRGVQVAIDGRAIYSADDAGDPIVLDGVVEGSYATPYATHVELGRNGTVVAYSCTCQAAASYPGMCKHEVGLALSYLSDAGLLDDEGDGGADAQRGASGGAAQGGDGGLTPRSGQRAGKAGKAHLDAPRPPHYEQTDRPVEQLVSDYAERAQRRARLTVRKPASPSTLPTTPVSLECIVSEGINNGYGRGYGYASDGGMYTLSLKVHAGKASYVVKSIRALVDAWERHEFVEYGKRLAFTHTPEAFDETANQVLSTLAPLVRAQASYNRAAQVRYYDNRTLSAKTLPLSADQLIALLDVLVGHQLTYETRSYDYYSGDSKEDFRLDVRRGDPQVRVRIARSASGDWDLECHPQGLVVVSGDEGLAVLGEDEALLASDEFAARMDIFARRILTARGTLHIREQDMPAFAAAALPTLRQFTQLDAPDELLGSIAPDPEFSFAIGEQDGWVTCDATVAYGTRTIPLFAPASPGQPVRDIERESEAQAAVQRYFPRGRYELPDYTDVGRGGGRYASSAWARAEQPAAARGGRPSGLASAAAGSDEPTLPSLDEDDDRAYFELLTQGIPALAELGEVRLSRRLANAKVISAPEVHVDASVHSGLLDLSVDSLGMTPAELLAYLGSYRRRQEYVRLSSGDVVRLAGSGVGAVADMADTLGISDEDLVAEGGVTLPANRTLFVDAMLKRAGGVRFDRDAGFRAIVRDFETVADAEFALPEGLQATLRPYQKEGYRWLMTLGSCGFGGILADDMGLGKTLELICYLLARKQGIGGLPQAGADAAEAAGADGSSRSTTAPSLVVCPASLVYNWESEARRFAPDLDVAVVAGTKGERMAQIGDAAGHDLLVTSYDLLKRDIETYQRQHFACVALDEAQYIKNSTTKAAKSAKLLDADVRFALTGTPIENRLSELWSIFDFLMPGVLGSKKQFAQRFAAPIEAGHADVAARLSRLVSPFILRRLKSDVLADLPEKNESVVIASLEGEQAKLYKSTASKLALMLADKKPAEFAGMKLQVLAELTRLRQICCDPNLLYDNYKGGSAKLDCCMDLVRSAVEGGHAILLFSQFTAMLDIIERRLGEEGIAYLELTGATPKEERVRLVKAFQAGEAPVFCISLKAGGTGLNLTAADMVIHYDPWWNVAAQDQATDRAHRIGQTREVTVFKLIAKDTIEERIVEMQEHKRGIADAVIGGAGVGSSTITKEDVLALLS